MNPGARHVFMGTRPQRGGPVAIALGENPLTIHSIDAHSQDSPSTANLGAIRMASRTPTANQLRRRAAWEHRSGFVPVEWKDSRTASPRMSQSRNDRRSQGAQS